MLSKIYVEITNVCNLNCSFCHGTKREKRFMSASEFARLAPKLRRATEYIYLHLMGEPLCHPELAKIIDVAAENGLKVSITTNGTLLKKCADTLLSRADKLYKISISLHSAEANKSGTSSKSGTSFSGSYIENTLAFAKKAGESGIISVLRLWNLESGANNTSSSGTQPSTDALAKVSEQNRAILEKMKEVFPLPWSENRSGMKIGKSAYLEWGERFDWPDISLDDVDSHGFCYGLHDHVGVLCDGTVVPCCLDADGEIALGNLFERELDEILSSPRALAIVDGFKVGKKIEPLCRRCGFSKRFK